jgi:hypothetical protein
MRKEIALSKSKSKKLTGTFTAFMDMYSGGSQKLGAEYIYIEASEDVAADIFEEIFSRDPRNVTCRCCGEDFFWHEENNPSVSDGSYVVTQSDIEKLHSSQAFDA